MSLPNLFTVLAKIKSDIVQWIALLLMKDGRCSLMFEKVTMNPHNDLPLCGITFSRILALKVIIDRKLEKETDYLAFSLPKRR